MTIYEQNAEIIHAIPEYDAVEIISDAAASCFGSKPADKYTHIEGIAKRGHLSVFEHINVIYKLYTDIATYKGLTRHRHCAFTIESTHYKSYRKGLAIIEVPDVPLEEQEEAFNAIEQIHQEWLRKYGQLAARNILPQAQGAQVTMTTNIRELYHIFALRSGKENTPNMYFLMEKMRAEFTAKYPFLMRLWCSYFQK